jgi:hypothetical protein
VKINTFILDTQLDRITTMTERCCHLEGRYVHLRQMVDSTAQTELHVTLLSVALILCSCSLLDGKIKEKNKNE